MIISPAVGMGLSADNGSCSSVLAGHGWGRDHHDRGDRHHRGDRDRHGGGHGDHGRGGGGGHHDGGHRGGHNR